MISSTEAYKKAIVADARRMYVKAIIDIISPDITYGTVTASAENAYSKPEQLHDKDYTTPQKYATLELNRWCLDGAWGIYPNDPASVDGAVGFIGDELSDENADFTSPVWVEMSFHNVSILQACSVYFSDIAEDGIPVDFTVEVKQGGTAYHTKTFTGNTKTSVSLKGFTVYSPDAIRVTVTKWSLPRRRLRAVEIIPGIYEEWDGNILASFSLKQQGDVSCVSLPYGTCSISMDNLDRRFEPRNKAGLFQSIEERQGVAVALGVRLEDGTTEYKQAGVYYQYSGGWKTGDNGLTMQWSLVDIIGLLQNREFVPPAELPQTLEGWVTALVAQLGVNFATRYTVDPAYASLPVVARSAEDVTGVTCGNILRYLCMATGTWPRADAKTGYLAVEPLWSEGNKLTLDNLTAYPVMRANSDLAAIIFTLCDGNNTQYVVSGNSTASSNTVSIKNPFVQTEDEARKAAKMILSAYGGNKIEITGRGDPSSEIGDVDTVWLDESSATTARRIQQNLSFGGGVLKDCTSVLLQADGSFLYQNREVITESGTWTAPSGVTSLRLILVGHGADGAAGENGGWDSPGADGADGSGGKVWAGTINVNERQSFDVTIGQDTVFGLYSSANGVSFAYGYTDIASGESFARTGVAAPLPNSGDGGKGGAGGAQGRTHTEWREYPNATTGGTTMWADTVVDSQPGKGKPGATGASGCVIIYYDEVSA